MASASTSITITYADVATPKDVTLELIDYCSADAITSATVTISGPNDYAYSGSPDADGKLALGVLQPGHYSMVVTASGYLSSSSDLLANDGFDV